MQKIHTVLFCLHDEVGQQYVDRLFLVLFGQRVDHVVAKHVELLDRDIRVLFHVGGNDLARNITLTPTYPDLATDILWRR